MRIFKIDAVASYGFFDGQLHIGGGIRGAIFNAVDTSVGRTPPARHVRRRRAGRSALAPAEPAAAARGDGPLAGHRDHRCGAERDAQSRDRRPSGRPLLSSVGRRPPVGGRVGRGLPDRPASAQHPVDRRGRVSRARGRGDAPDASQAVGHDAASPRAAERERAPHPSARVSPSSRARSCSCRSRCSSRDRRRAPSESSRCSRRWSSVRARARA